MLNTEPVTCVVCCALLCWFLFGWCVGLFDGCVLVVDRRDRRDRRGRCDRRDRRDRRTGRNGSTGDRLFYGQHTKKQITKHQQSTQYTNSTTTTLQKLNR